MSADPLEIFSEAERTDLSDWVGEWLEEGHTAYEIADAFGQFISEHPKNHINVATLKAEREDIHEQIGDVIKRIRDVALRAGMTNEQIVTLVGGKDG